MRTVTIVIVNSAKHLIMSPWESPNQLCHTHTHYATPTTVHSVLPEEVQHIGLGWSCAILYLRWCNNDACQ